MKLGYKFSGILLYIKILLEEYFKTWEDSHNDRLGLKERILKIVCLG